MTTRNGPPGYVANQFPSICRAGLIGGAGGCTGAGVSVGIEGPLLCWNDCELHPGTRHTRTIARDANTRWRKFSIGSSLYPTAEIELGARRSIAEPFRAPDTYGFPAVEKQFAAR